MRTILVAAVAVTVISTPAVTRPTQHWVAVDRITIGATGDLTLDGDQLSFASDGSIRLHLVKAHVMGRWSNTNATQQADIYKVVPPARPTSARGDVLCNAPATYIVFSRPVPSDLVMSVYSGPTVPKGDGANEPCANFNYSEG